jgi:hypothetical protein
MIEITPSATSQRHPFLPPVVCRRRPSSLDELQPTLPGHRRNTELDLDAGTKCCLATPGPSKHRKAVVPTARKPMLAVLNSP